jgi:hypothetical protein
VFTRTCTPRFALVPASAGIPSINLVPAALRVIFRDDAMG